MSGPDATQQTIDNGSAAALDGLRSALNAGRVGHWVLNLATGDFHASELCRSVVGRSSNGSFSEADFRAAIHPDDRDRVSAAMAATLATGLDYDIDYRLVAPDAGETWILERGRAVAGADGEPASLAGISIDITTRKQHDAALALGHRALARDRAWKHSLDLQLIIGADGIIGAANDAWESVLGWSADEVIGRHFSCFTHPDDRDATEEAVRIARGDELRRFVKRCLHKTDGVRWISWVAAPEDGAVSASGRDVTQERAAAAAVAGLERQLRQSQKMEALGQLTGGVAHDFNNYLGVIQNSLMALRQTLLPDADPADAEEATAAGQRSRTPSKSMTITEMALDRGERAVRQAGTLTQRLLSFAHDQPLHPEATDLAYVLRCSAELIRSSLPASITLELSTPDDAPCFAFVDANRLDNALLNLCINARDAMTDGGTLRLSVREISLDETAAAELALSPGRHACIEVADEGTGLSDEVRLRMFDPFFTTKTRGQGTGLGLSMVYAFMQQSGGRITAESAGTGAGTGSGTGRGTVMTLYLRAMDQEARPMESES